MPLVCTGICFNVTVNQRRCKGRASQPGVGQNRQKLNHQAGRQRMRLTALTAIAAEWGPERRRSTTRRLGDAYGREWAALPTRPGAQKTVRLLRGRQEEERQAEKPKAADRELPGADKC